MSWLKKHEKSKTNIKKTIQHHDNFGQSPLFTLLAVKIYTRNAYWQIIDLLDLYNKIQRYLHLKKVTHSQTPHKFFQRPPTAALQDLNKQILTNQIHRYAEHLDDNMEKISNNVENYYKHDQSRNNKKSYKTKSGI